MVTHLRTLCLDKGGVKQDTLTALCTAPVQLQSLFPDQLLVKAEDEISRSEERRSSSSSYRKPGRFHSYASSTTKPSHQPDQKAPVPAWKQIRDRQQGKKYHGKAPTFTHKGSLSNVNDNYCVKCVTGLNDCACVSGKLESLNPLAVIARNKDLTSKCETVNLNVNSCVVNPVFFCQRVSTKERCKSQLLLSLSVKVCERCFLCRSLVFCKAYKKSPNCCSRSTCRGQIAPV